MMQAKFYIQDILFKSVACCLLKDGCYHPSSILPLAEWEHKHTFFSKCFTLVRGALQGESLQDEPSPRTSMVGVIETHLGWHLSLTCRIDN
jgi:hypothetical protein